jgi:hypothetical protein
VGPNPRSKNQTEYFEGKLAIRELGATESEPWVNVKNFNDEFPF